jgi:hypothetical protein
MIPVPRNLSRRSPHVASLTIYCRSRGASRPVDLSLSPSRRSEPDNRQRHDDDQKVDYHWRLAVHSLIGHERTPVRYATRLRDAGPSPSRASVPLVGHRQMAGHHGLSNAGVETGLQDTMMPAGMAPGDPSTHPSRRLLSGRRRRPARNRCCHLPPAFVARAELHSDSR